MAGGKMYVNLHFYFQVFTINLSDLGRLTAGFQTSETFVINLSHFSDISSPVIYRGGYSCICVDVHRGI